MILTKIQKKILIVMFFMIDLNPVSQHNYIKGFCNDENIDIDEYKKERNTLKIYIKYL